MSEIHGNMIPAAVLLEKEVMEEKLSLIKEIRQKKENKLYQLLAELLDTERKYVQDLEQVTNKVDCDSYFSNKNSIKSKILSADVQ